MNQVKIRANAKINLALSVEAKRNDGYHNIDTVFQSISLSDNITIELNDKIQVYCDKIPECENLVFKAANMFFDFVSIKSGAKIFLEKNIPLSSGLGGGSSDAAATLKGLDMLYGTNLKSDDLFTIARKLGADVPFFLLGGTKRATGIGDKLIDVPPLPDCYIVIIKDRNKISTAHMFSLIDSSYYQKPDISKLVSSLYDGNILSVTENIKNSFSCFYPFNELKSILTGLGAKGISLTGSGPSFFAIFKDRDLAFNAVEKLKLQNIEAYMTSPCNNSLIFE